MCSSPLTLEALQTKIVDPRLVLREVLSTSALSVKNGKHVKKVYSYRLRVLDTATGYEFCCELRSLQKFLKRGRLSDFFGFEPASAAFLVQQYNHKLEAVGLGSSYKILSHLSITHTGNGDKKEPTHNFLVRDLTTGTEYETQWDTLRRFGSSSKRHNNVRNLEVLWQNKLDSVCPGRLTVTKVTKSKSNPRIQVQDSNGVTYEYSAYSLVSLLEEDPAKKLQPNTWTPDAGVVGLDGKSASVLASELGLSTSYVWKTLANPEFTDEQKRLLLADPQRGKSSIEVLVHQMLVEALGDSSLIISDKALEDHRFRPDFRIPSHNLIVEANGLYHHREELYGKNYHLERKNIFEARGYRSLFFLEDEIRNRPKVVESIIRNALKLNFRRFYARKLAVIELDPDFFDTHHLMGRGKGKCFGLEAGGEVVAGICVKFKNKAEGLLDVSRFCTAPCTTVVGGFSRLIQHAVRELSTSKVQTFIDLRYGTGSHLASMNWKLRSCNLSFVWAKGNTSVHRMRFPGNTGYDYGYWKVWDCGQARWELDVS